MASRSLNDLHPIVKGKAEEFLKRCDEAGVKVLIYCTLRSIQEQDELYAQGRTKPGKKVTNAKGGQSFHNFGVAFDCVPLVDGKAVWNRSDLYQKIGQIGRELGLEWAGDWKKFKEFPHFQYTGGLTLQDYQAGKRLG